MQELLPLPQMCPSPIQNLLEDSFQVIHQGYNETITFQGDYWYFYTCTPRLAQIAKPSGREIITTSHDQYMKLYFDSYGYVQAVTYLGKQKPQANPQAH